MRNFLFVFNFHEYWFVGDVSSGTSEELPKGYHIIKVDIGSQSLQ